MTVLFKIEMELHYYCDRSSLRYSFVYGFPNTLVVMPQMPTLMFLLELLEVNRDKIEGCSCQYIQGKKFQHTLVVPTLYF